ncbi:Os03g0653201 [Oryza sativa Japonica Group]|uniref:Os03g0653201 protein n=1 Tax=Oryza sativa subsp. japonica TaxID=39947 RepID=A0A0P0W1P3_ORYSJ|nr:Os03g0653201 [Oryza sativa Japonica Group]
MQAAVKHCRRGGGGISRSGMECEGYLQVSKEGMQSSGAALPAWGGRWMEGSGGGAALPRGGRRTKELAVLVGRGATTRQLACCFTAALRVPELAGAALRGAVFPIAGGGGRARRRRSTATCKRRRGRRKPPEIRRCERQ